MARIAEKDNPADVLTNFVSREDFLTVTAAVLALRRQRGEQPESPSGERLEAARGPMGLDRGECETESHYFV